MLLPPQQLSAVQYLRLVLSFEATCPTTQYIRFLFCITYCCCVRGVGGRRPRFGVLLYRRRSFNRTALLESRSCQFTLPSPSGDGKKYHGSGRKPDHGCSGWNLPCRWHRKHLHGQWLTNWLVPGVPSGWGKIWKATVGVVGIPRVENIKWVAFQPVGNGSWVGGLCFSHGRQRIEISFSKVIVRAALTVRSRNTSFSWKSYGI